MRVLFATSEIYPYVKTGGLGDVSAALPFALFKKNVDVRLFLPGYPQILARLADVETLVSFPVYFGAYNVRLLRGTLDNGFTAYVLDAPSFYNRSSPYVGPDGQDWPDNAFRFAAFSRAAADCALYDPDGWTPQIIHGHDWQAGLICAYNAFRETAKPKTVLTIHNIAYQGLFPPHLMPLLGLPPESYHAGGVEFYNKIGFLKAGLAYADHITTVSPTYAREIQDWEQGCGLDGLLRHRAKDLTGILNGMDKDVWNPAIDKYIVKRYDVKTLDQRRTNRDYLIERFKLDTDTRRPLFTVVSRLSPQKGLDLLLEAIPHLLQQGGNMIVLGSGDRDLEMRFREIAAANPSRIALETRYDETLAHQLQAGADVTLMPSRAEPCGLVQMYALAYGALPLVRDTGGLADTVTDISKPAATGFMFKEATTEALKACLDKVFEYFPQKNLWEAMQKRGMGQDLGWEKSAEQYAGLYQSLSRP